MKTILHIDIDAFFASVEEIYDSTLKNKPIVVTGIHSKRSVVSCPNYIARSYGVKSAMPVFIAKQKCKNLILVPCHFSRYEHYSNIFMSLIRSNVSNKIEIMSIDECFVDITHLCNATYNSFGIAKRIQKLVYKKLGLSISIGISYNKFLAKMASDLEKPMGIVSILTKKDIIEKIWNLPIESMLYVGKSRERLLKDNGYKKIFDLADPLKKHKLLSLLKDAGNELYLLANGLSKDDEINVSNDQPKSISCSETFLEDTNDIAEIRRKLFDQTINVVSRMKNHNLLCKTISVIVKFTDFRQKIKRITLPEYTNNFHKICNFVLNIYYENFMNKDIRLVGVSLSSLVKSTTEITPIFDQYSNKKNIHNELLGVIKKINKMCNVDILDFASEKLKK